MDKWEYKNIAITIYQPDQGNLDSTFESLLAKHNEFEEDGWELISGTRGETRWVSPSGGPTRRITEWTLRFKHRVLSKKNL